MSPRLRVFFFHLTASVVMATSAAALVFLVWYPSPTATAVGLDRLFPVLLGVDVVLGPLLTLVVYKVGKKSLRFDLSIIIALQLIAFGYGLWTITSARPAWLVFNADRFDLAQAHELDTRFPNDTRAEFLQAPWTGPRWVASRNPKDLKKHNALMLESSMGGPDLPQRTDLYVPLEEEVMNIQKMAHPMAELSRYNSPSAVQSMQAKWPEADAWLPLMAKAKPMTVLLNKSEGKIIAIVDLRPW